MTGTAEATLSGALEDYLETIFLLICGEGFARVRDIAKARSVKSSSVSPALRRLAELGLIKYVQREYVGLTDSGERAARRVLARHELLARFFSQVLRMSPEAADREACMMEHNLSAEAMDRLVRFFEFLRVCPEGRPNWLDKFHSCSMVQEGAPNCAGVCGHKSLPRAQRADMTTTLSDLEPGQEGQVTQVNAQGAVRQRLLDMGLLPDVVVRVERVALGGDPIWIRFKGSQVALRRDEARSVLLTTG
jgi:DtxR family transcriptional regulator, Mn-dependent transcriptional regulator